MAPASFLQELQKVPISYDGTLSSGSKPCIMTGHLLSSKKICAFEKIYSEYILLLELYFFVTFDFTDP